ncbi:hypothetical protein JHD48_02325 [Sulfurimonas sp. SAG-AH-194-I05]|nr:hypothetical protein [Sulfurimonas sp. SAG-AH-194-I05]MDF1874565.1 hypothetical protein [Sulfurimonas sp. SAG-AH-194-I05]
MQENKFNRILSFLLGASWAIVFFGALITFKLFAVLGIAIAFFATTTYLFISLFLILGLDAFAVNKQRLNEAKKQTKLLEKIYTKHTK